MSLRSFIEDYRHVSNTHDRVASRATKVGTYLCAASLMVGLGVGARTIHDALDHKPIKDDIEYLVGDLAIGALGAGATRHIVNAEILIDEDRPDINHNPDWSRE